VPGTVRSVSFNRAMAAAGRRWAWSACWLPWRSCIIAAVSTRSGAEARSPYDLLRLVVLGLTLMAFMAMHGLASAGGESSHCAVPDTLLSPVAKTVRQ
jgi:hypothetical protein